MLCSLCARPEIVTLPKPYAWRAADIDALLLSARVEDPASAETWWTDAGPHVGDNGITASRVTPSRASRWEGYTGSAACPARVTVFSPSMRYRVTGVHPKPMVVAMCARKYSSRHIRRLAFQTPNPNVDAAVPGDTDRTE